MVYLSSFLMDTAITLLMLGLTFRSVDARASPTELGVLGSSFSLSYCFLCFSLAKWFSRLNIRVSTASSTVVLLILCVLGGMVPSVPLFILLGILTGAASSFFWPPLEHYLAHGKPPEGLYRALSRFNLWWCAGIAAGAAICGPLYQWGFRKPFFTAALCLVPILVGAPFVRSPASTREQTTSPANPSSQIAVSLHRKRGFLTTARLFIFLTYASGGCIFALFPKLADTLHLAKPLVSRILFSLFTGQLLSFYILAKTRKWRENAWFLLGGQVLIAAAFVAVFLTDRPVIFAGGFAIVGMVSGLSYFSSLFYTLQEPVFKSSLAGVHEALLAAGRLFGPLFFGVVAAIFGLKLPYLLLACIFALFGARTLFQSRTLA